MENVKIVSAVNLDAREPRMYVRVSRSMNVAMCVLTWMYRVELFRGVPRGIGFVKVDHSCFWCASVRSMNNVLEQ